MKMSKLKEIFAAVAIVCHRNEVLAGLKMFSQLFSFGQIKALKKKHFGETKHKKKKKKRRSRDEMQRLWLKKCLNR